MRHIGSAELPLYDLIGNDDALAFLNFPEIFLTIFSASLKG
jgi:hypothetical protein